MLELIYAVTSLALLGIELPPAFGAAVLGQAVENVAAAQAALVRRGVVRVAHGHEAIISSFG